MIAIRIGAVALGVFLVMFLLKPRSEMPIWYLITAAIILALVNCGIFTMLRFLANSGIWAVYGFLSVLINYTLLYFSQKRFALTYEMATKTKLILTSMLISSLSAFGYWLL